MNLEKRLSLKLSKKEIKLEILFKMQFHEINEAINYLGIIRDSSPNHLKYAYKILKKQIPKEIKLKSKRSEYLQQLEKTYNSLNN